MAGASIETTLELWASSLRDVKARIRPLFRQQRVVSSAGLFLDGLLGNEPRKTGWMRAEAAGDPGPWRQQAILGRGWWDADALRDIVRNYALETLADEDAVLVIDETGFLKQGKASCGVARQYTGSAGKITNCQIGVFASYVTGRDSGASPVRSAGPPRDRHLSCARTGYWMQARVPLCGHCGVPSPRRPGTSRQPSTPRQEG
jgi:SRSO17 transposase